MSEAADAIKREANALGFSHVGIARAVNLVQEGARLREWVQKGYHASMEYLANAPDRRSRPGDVLHGARSVVVVAANYYTRRAHEENPERGKLSRYAWGDDYHEILDAPLKELELRLQSLFPGHSTRRYIDTGPVMEKAWAVRAGIGWQGKHTNVITRDFGSWVFLGGILTTADIEEDTPVEDYCGSCTACIEACPTAAIVEPYVLDAERCISYLTIELKGDALPGSESRPFHNWIFGCDICQDVCPWNTFAQETSAKEYHPRNGETTIALKEILAMDPGAFSMRFRHSPIKRAKLAGLQRNARIVSLQNESH